MLVLTRKIDEQIIIGDNITIRVLKIDGNKIRIGIEAPENVPIRREEIGASGPSHQRELHWSGAN